MEAAFESEEYYHSETVAPNVNAVVRTDLLILGKHFDCITDTGASIP